MRALLLTCIFIMYSILTQAQTLSASDVNKKWGKVTQEELAMTVYPKDTSAKAVVLYQQRFSNYNYNPNAGFKITHYITQKIKILKTEGKDEGTIEIPYYFRTNGDRELISSLEAWSYNLVGGKIVKTKLKKEYIFDEEINSKYRIIKFSLPEVNVGTVIEYRYNKTTEYVYSLPDWDIQRDIPVLNNDFQVNIPEYFDFNLSVKGFEMLDIKDKAENTQFNVGNDANGSVLVSCTMRCIKCIAQDIPALKDEDYVWCLDDYISGVRFELRGTRFPNTMYKPFTQTWESLEKTIRDETDMPQYLRIGNPWKSETNELIANITDEKEKISILYDFIKKKIRWNDRYTLIGENPREAVKNGIGSNVQINYLLMSVLRDADIRTYPVLISRRTNGRLPYGYPSINKLSTFIVAAQAKDSSVYYMDGSSKYGGPNILPTSLLVDRGRIFDDGTIEKWTDISKLTPNFQISTIEANLDSEGLLKGIRNTSYTNQLAYDYKSNFAAAKDSMDFVKNYQNKYDVMIDSLEIGGKEPMSPSVNERVVFSKQMDLAGDYIYMNPMVFKHLTENHFTQTERKMPVEFAYQAGYQTICTINLPENYEVEELPKSVKYVITGNKGYCQFFAQKSERTVVLKYVFQMNQLIFPESDYQTLRDFYGQAVAKNMEMLVLKKKAQL